MPDRAAIRTSIKLQINRAPGDIDTILNDNINTGVDLLGDMVESIQGEQIWERTITAAEVTANNDNWLLPSKTRRIVSAAHIDTTGDYDIELPIDISSPQDTHSVGELERYGGSYYPTEFSTGGWQWNKYRPSRRGTVRNDGRPTVGYRINNNFYVYPRPDTNEVNNKIQLIITRKPADLSTDTDTNIITDNHPRALVHYVAAITWFLWGQEVKGTLQLQIAAKLLEEYIDEQSMQKLMSTTQTFIGRR